MRELDVMTQKRAMLWGGCLLLAILALGMVVPVGAATNQIGYFTVAGITDKCSSQPGHENSCPVVGIVQQVANTAVTPGGAGRSTFSFVVVKLVDKASPKLLEACVTGRTYDQAGITFSGNPFAVTLSEVQVTGVTQSTNPDAASSQPVLEEVTLVFSRIRWQFAGVSTGWDLKANRPTLAPAGGGEETPS